MKTACCKPMSLFLLLLLQVITVFLMVEATAAATGPVTGNPEISGKNSVPVAVHRQKRAPQYLG